MLKAAKRLADRLEDLGWTVYWRKEVCKQCGKRGLPDDKYCSNCGTELEAYDKNNTIKELQQILEYSLEDLKK